MKFTFLLLAFVIFYFSADYNYVSARPSNKATIKVCDSRQFLNLYQRTCIYYGKRKKNSNIYYRNGSYRIQRDTSNQLEPDPAPELARKCCEDGCSVDLIALHCNNI